MIFRNYNDFEIVNMIKQGNEDAFGFMVNKYEYFIAKKIRNFNLTNQFEDIFQESLMILYKSIQRFDESFNKTFMRYFEMNLHNRFITIKNKDNRYGEFLATKMQILYDYNIRETPNYYLSDWEITEALSTLSGFEKLVFQTHIVENKDIKNTADLLKCNEKKIYNAMDRIKKKIKLHLM